MSISDFSEPDRIILNKHGDEKPSYVKISTSYGTEKPVMTHDITEATKLLGLNFTPTGDSSTHVDEKLRKDYEWVDKLALKPMA